MDEKEEATEVARNVYLEMLYLGMDESGQTRKSNIQN